VPLRDGADLLGLLLARVTGPDGAARLSRRLPALEAFASLASALLARDIVERQREDATWSAIERAIVETGFWPVFQPIIELARGRVVGYEALTRFRDGTPADRRFADAAAVGLGDALESATLTASIERAGDLPGGAFVSLNVSPQLVLAGDRLPCLLEAAPVPVVLEITEHIPVQDYPRLRQAITSLGTTIRFAVDDAGSGFASFRHILELRPDFVKLDIGLVREIDRDPARQAFVAAMVDFAARTRCTLIAEGIETDAERAMLDELGVHLGQGYLIGRPAPVPS
jgi:EAL domain-containing protein (putative c-di-GMP-specific phosphodiesterase class I)